MSGSAAGCGPAVVTPQRSQATRARQVRIDRGGLCAADQGQLTSDESAELVQFGKEIRVLRREKDFCRLAAALFAKGQLPPRGFA